jgi:serine/threonine protein kinase
MTTSAVHLESIDAEWSRVARALAGRYDLVRDLGHGGMSRVFLAWDRRASRKVAVKALAPGLVTSVESRERFRREALIASQLTHPHIVPCYEFVWDGSVAAAVMRYVPGGSLGDRLSGGRRLPLDQVLRIVLPIADALTHAHKRGVVHRDVKPANILLQSEDAWPFLTDFGIATLRTSDQSRAEATRRFGTPEFMSPEQALGDWDADHRSDIYSLGLVAYVALAGRLPFRDAGVLGLTAQRAVTDAPPLASMAPHLPLRFTRVIDRCLTRVPKRRWRDAATFASELSDSLRPANWWQRWLASLRFVPCDPARPKTVRVIGE